MPPHPNRRAVPAAMLAALTILACQADTTPGANGTEAATVPSGDTGLVPGTPEGDLQQWVSDVRQELATLPALADTAPAAARQRAVDLYVGRQEFIELYYGDGGRLGDNQELATAVDRAEARFHDLMLLLGGEPPPSADEVRGAAERLEAAHATVLEKAHAAGVPLDPRAAVQEAGA